MKFPRLTGAGHLPTMALSLALGAAGGFAAAWLNLPLPMLLGSLMAVGAASVIGVRPLGHLPQVPARLRQFFVPVIGVAIGSAIRPEILAEAAHWWPSVMALCLFIPAIHFAGYKLLLAAGKIDPVTALFGAAPGGLIEAVQMGDELGADTGMLTMLQFLRLILTIVLVPIAFSWMAGHPVGSGGGAVLEGSELPIGARDLVILLFAAVAGSWLGGRLRMPAAFVTGPLLLSGLAQLAGLTQTVPPPWLLDVTQVVIGTSLGTRFAGMPYGRMLAALRLSAMTSAMSLAAAALVALALAPIVAEPASAVFLAFAPGGLAEMTLIAVSLNLSIVYIAAHHVLRIVLAVLVARHFARRFRR